MKKENMGAKNQTALGVFPKLLFMLAGVLAAMQAATQSFSAKLDYHAALGEPMFGKIYYPWSILKWYFQHGETHAETLKSAGAVGFIVLVLSLLALMFMVIVKQNTAKAARDLHGSARWATKAEIIKAGLLPDDSLMKRIKGLLGFSEIDKRPFVYVGGWKEKTKSIFGSKEKVHYLRHYGAEHVLTIAPTRSGKGVGLVVPTLNSWTGSTIVTDLKGELWELSAGWRQKHAGNKVLRFEPASLDSVRWNPLEEIRLGSEQAVGDAQNLAMLIVDPDGHGLEGEGSHWKKTSHALLTGLILHLLHKGREDGFVPSLADVDKSLADPEHPVSLLWDEMRNNEWENGDRMMVVASAGQDMKDRPEEEAGSVLSTAKSYLSLYRDPTVAKNVSTCDFRLKDLMHHEQPVSLYIVTQPNDKARLRPLVRIMMNMSLRLLADKLEFENGRPKANYKHRLLLMVDEFPSLGKLDIMQESLAFIAGYGILAYLICQDRGQLTSEKYGYGKDETITGNTHIQNAYAPNKLETAEYLAKKTGEQTVLKKQITTSGKRTGLSHSNVSTTYQETKRSLLTADECTKLPAAKKDASGSITEGGDMLIFVAGMSAIYGCQTPYFLDPVFSKRAAVKAPEKSDRL